MIFAGLLSCSSSIYSFNINSNMLCRFSQLWMPLKRLYTMECQQGQKTSATKQKQFVFVSLPNHWKLSETKTFCFCFAVKQMTAEWNKNKFLFECPHREWVKEKLFSFCFRNIVKTSGETKTFDKAWSAIKLKGRSFCFVIILFTVQKFRPTNFNNVFQASEFQS